ncbi:hypothetical protein MRX96_015552 [Rhipicephalus microplus]
MAAQTEKDVEGNLDGAAYTEVVGDEVALEDKNVTLTLVRRIRMEVEEEIVEEEVVESPQGEGEGEKSQCCKAESEKRHGEVAEES